MAARPPIELSADQRSIVAAGKALKAETDGKTLRRELIKEMRATATPLVAELKTAAMAIPSSGSALTPGQPLRPAIAASLKPVARLSGQNPGVSIKARRTPNVRGFNMAARRMNQDSFRRRVFGRDVWVNQPGDAGWFDKTVKDRRDQIRRDVMKAIDATVTRLASRTKGS